MSSDDLHHADPASAEDGVPGTLAGLITQCAKGVTRWDEDFARAVAASLHARSGHLTFPEVDAMGLEEVVITFYMDRELRLVVTGTVGRSGGLGSVRWREGDFARVPVVLHRQARTSPYLFATLDFSHRGRRATLITDVPPHASGQQVLIRCLATVGDDVTYRVVVGDQEVSVAPERLCPIDS
jgi:hypothetical protein